MKKRMSIAGVNTNGVQLNLGHFDGLDVEAKQPVVHVVGAGAGVDHAIQVLQKHTNCAIVVVGLEEPCQPQLERGILVSSKIKPIEIKPFELVSQDPVEMVVSKDHPFKQFFGKKKSNRGNKRR